MLDVAAPAHERNDLLVIYVEAGDIHAGARELQGEGESDVAESDDADFHVMVRQLGRVTGCLPRCERVSSRVPSREFVSAEQVDGKQNLPGARSLFAGSLVAWNFLYGFRRRIENA